MKKGLIIGKRQIAVVALILALGGAVWLNMEYAGKNMALGDPADTSSKVLGQAQYVGAQPSEEEKDDYFSTTRKSRSESRAEAVKLLQETVNNVKSGDEAIAKAQEEINRIAKDIETESAIESLVKAKGFGDVVAVMSADDISVVVKSEEKLLQSETMQIMDIVRSKTDFSADKIKILASK